MAFNGDLESRLALHWLVHERGYQVLSLSINLGQEIYLEPLGELALELGASAAQVIDRRHSFLVDYAFPILQADAVYQQSCFLGSALARYLIAEELVRVAHEEGSDLVAHAASMKGNDQVRMETAIGAQDPNLKVLAPVREWNLKNLADKVRYAKARNLPIEEPFASPVVVDRNLWGASLFFTNENDAWDEVPAETFVMTNPVEKAPNEPVTIVIGFREGIPVSLDGKEMEPIPLVRELNRIGGLHGIGRSDVVEDRLFGIKSREIYETPAASILLIAHRDLESLVHSKEMHQIREMLSRRYAELVYTGLWFHDVRIALYGFFRETQKVVTGDVRVRLYKGSFRVKGRRSPNSIYEPKLANQTNMEMFESQWAKGFTTLWALQARLAARMQPKKNPRKPSSDE